MMPKHSWTRYTSTCNTSTPRPDYIVGIQVGIQVDSSLKNLFKLNYPVLIQKRERVSCMEMNNLPRIMFLSQSSPIPLPLLTKSQVER